MVQKHTLKTNFGAALKVTYFAAARANSKFSESRGLPSWADSLWQACPKNCVAAVPSANWRLKPAADFFTCSAFFMKAQRFRLSAAFPEKFCHAEIRCAERQKPLALSMYLGKLKMPQLHKRCFCGTGVWHRAVAKLGTPFFTAKCGRGGAACLPGFLRRVSETSIFAARLKYDPQNPIK